MPSALDAGRYAITAHVGYAAQEQMQQAVAGVAEHCQVRWTVVAAVRERLDVMNEEALVASETALAPRALNLGMEVPDFAPEGANAHAGTVAFRSGDLDRLRDIKRRGEQRPAPAGRVGFFDADVIPAPPREDVGGEALAVFADVDGEAEGLEGRLVAGVRAVEAEPAPEVATWRSLPDVAVHPGGPAVDLCEGHGAPPAGRGA